jgi:hypothetical protein
MILPEWCFADKAMPIAPEAVLALALNISGE